MLRKVFVDPFEGQRGVFHLTSSHLETSLLFQNEVDWRFGVNSLAICLIGQPAVSLLCYVLMGNHIHLLLRGRYADCMAYCDKLFYRLTAHIGRSRRRNGLLALDDVDIKPVTNNKQFQNTVIYILRNPFRARIASPFSYRWSSIGCYFPAETDPSSGRPVSAFTQRELRGILHTQETCPATWRIRNGVICNDGFVEGALVERAFGDSVNYFSKMRIYDMESAIKMADGAEEWLRYTDEELREKIALICETEFHVKNVGQLDRKSLLLLARTIARRFGASKKQIARLTGISIEVLDSVL